MDILKMAKQLGEAIAGSKEMRELKKAEATLMVDREAKDLYQKYREAKFKKLRAELLYKDSPSDIAEIEDRALKNPLIKRLISCQESFSRLIKNVNAVMAFAIENAPLDGGCFKGCHGNCDICTKEVFDFHGYTDDKTI
ncbi:MAG TPA: YlbF family regulator [Thermoanaerobacterales bacterium]|nr:YlbF family regulator [Thermoanaerobacterales bacterium]